MFPSCLNDGDRSINSPISNFIDSLKNKLVNEFSSIYNWASDSTEQKENFIQFCKENNIEYQPIQPLWPRANPIAERFMRNLNNTVRCAQEGKSWRTAWNDFLRHYRETPHSSTEVSPNDAMNLKNELRIPFIEKSLNSREIKEKLEKFDKKNKASIKRHADISMKVKENKMKIIQ